MAGVCIDKVATGPSSFLAATTDCDAKNARLMSWLEFRVLRSKPGFEWAGGSLAQYEFIDLYNVSGAVITPNAVNYGGAAFGDATAQSFLAPLRDGSPSRSTPVTGPACAPAPPSGVSRPDRTPVRAIFCPQV